MVQNPGRTVKNIQKSTLRFSLSPWWINFDLGARGFYPQSNRVTKANYARMTIKTYFHGGHILHQLVSDRNSLKWMSALNNNLNEWRKWKLQFICVTQSVNDDVLHFIYFYESSCTMHVAASRSDRLTDSLTVSISWVKVVLAIFVEYSISVRMDKPHKHSILIHRS